MGIIAETIMFSSKYIMWALIIWLFITIGQALISAGGHHIQPAGGDLGKGISSLKRRGDETERVEKDVEGTEEQIGRVDRRERAAERQGLELIRGEIADSSKIPAYIKEMASRLQSVTSLNKQTIDAFVTTISKVKDLEKRDTQRIEKIRQLGDYVIKLERWEKKHLNEIENKIKREKIEPEKANRLRDSIKRQINTTRRELKLGKREVGSLNRITNLENGFNIKIAESIRNIVDGNKGIAIKDLQEAARIKEEEIKALTQLAAIGDSLNRLERKDIKSGNQTETIVRTA